jgi:tetratricopeptide (TPR) repeat protein
VSRHLGAFDPLGYFIYLPNFDFADVEAFLSITRDLDPGSDTLAEALEKIGTDSTYLRALSTISHEAVHFYQVAGTPFGQFWTHLLQAQSLAVEALVKPKPGPLRESDRPLELSLPLASNTHGLPGGQEALDRVLEIWQCLDKAQKDLIDQSPDNMSAVLNTINDALLFTYSLGYWDERNLLVQGLHDEVPLVISELPSTARAYPEVMGGLTTRDILEAQARLLELRALGSVGAFELADQVMREGDSTNQSTVLKVMGAIQGVRFQYPVELLTTVSALIDLALFVPFDPACRRLWSKCQLWEDIHPAHRYVRAVRASEKLGLLEKMEDYDRYLEEVCNVAGWLRPQEILSATLPALDKGGSIYDRFAAALLRIRNEHPGVIAASAFEHIGLFPPPMIVYKSSVKGMESKQNPDLTSQASVAMLINNYFKRELARQILMEKEITAPDLALTLGWKLDVFLRTRMGVAIHTAGIQEGTDSKGRDELYEASFESELAREIQREQSEADRERLTSIDERHADGLACLGRGMDRWLKGSNFAAEEHFTKAIALGLDTAPVYEVRGWARRRQNNFQGAEEDFTEAIDLGSSGARVHVGRGLVRGYQEKFTEAEKDFNNAIKLEPNHSDFYFFRGVVRFRLGRYAMAEADFTTAISEGSNGANVYRKRAITRLQQNKLAEAETDLTSAIERGDTGAEVYLQRAGVRLDQDKVAGAEKDLTSAIERGETDAEIFLARGVARASLGRNGEAEGDFTIAIELGRKDSETLYRRGVARSYIGDQTGAEDDLNAAMELGMSDSTVYQARGRVRSLRGAHDEAEEDFTKALASNPKDASLYYERGTALRDQGKHGAAESDFTQAIALDAGQPEYYEMRALSRCEQGDKAGASRDLAQADALKKLVRRS